MKGKTIGIILAVVIIAFIVWAPLSENDGEVVETGTASEIPQAEISTTTETSAPEANLPVTVKEFTIVAKKWDFNPETITVNLGDTVMLHVESIDVAHGIAINSFNINERLNPGQTVDIEFVADKTGTFSFFCSVSCGSGHGGMRGTLIVE